MIELSEIQWTGSTMNFGWGCKMKSDGCRYCYMYRLSEQWGKDPVNCTRTSKATWRKAYKWNREVDAGKRTGTNKLVFTCSMTDFFNEEADEWRPEAWDVIRDTPNLIWQILTKLPNRIQDHLPPYWDEIRDRIWLMTSVENQKNDWRINTLLNVHPRPAIYGLSVEPLIGPLRLDESHFNVDWVVIGGESGNKTGKYLARPMELEWVDTLIRDCRDLNIAPFVKQLGSVWARSVGDRDWHGGTIENWPANLQIREFPEYKI